MIHPPLETAIEFKRVCLHCGQPNHSPGYTCNCRGQDWTRHYRVLDVKAAPEEISTRASQSFDSYSFDDAAGMLQYGSLPYRHIGQAKAITVGLTPLYRLSRLSEEYGCDIYLKNEGDNPSGCFKDRESLMCMLHSNSMGWNKAVIYSSGNAAASAAAFVENTARRLITFVAGDTYPEKIDYIRSHGSDVVVIGDRQTNFETGYRLFSQVNADGIFNEQGFDNWSVQNPYRVQGDKTIAVEIARQLAMHQGKSAEADFVLVPTANGSCLAGIWKGFKELKQAGIITKLPRMVAVGIANANPVCKAVRQGETTQPVRCDLSRVDDDDADVGSIILAEEGYDSIEAAKAVLESGGVAIELHASDLRDALVDLLTLEGSFMTSNGILPEPAALTSLAAIEKLKKLCSVSRSDKVISIMTGHGLKAQAMIRSMLAGQGELQEKVDEIIARCGSRMQPAGLKKGREIHVRADVDAVSRCFYQLQKYP